MCIKLSSISDWLSTSFFLKNKVDKFKAKVTRAICDHEREIRTWAFYNSEKLEYQTITCNDLFDKLLIVPMVSMMKSL